MSDSSSGSVLVTGGAGFIGSHVARRLLDMGCRVRVFDNFATGRRSNLDAIKEAEVREGDVGSRSDVASAIRGSDVVFHLAALPSVARSWTDPVGSLAVNAHGTANVAEAAAANGVSTLIYSSSSSIYGDQVAEKKSEDLEPRPISPYGYSKLLGEMIALAHARAPEGMRGAALRYFNVSGPRQDPNSPTPAAIPCFITHALAGPPPPATADGTRART